MAATSKKVHQAPVQNLIVEQIYCTTALASAQEHIELLSEGEPFLNRPSILSHPFLFTIVLEFLQDTYQWNIIFNPLMPVGNYSYQFFICCPRDWVSRHNGGTSGAPLKPLRVDSALRALSTLRGLRGAPEVSPLCRETQSLGQQMKNW